MNREILTLIGFAFSFVIGAGCAWFFIRHSRRSVIDAMVLADVQRRLNEWDAWYSRHMSECASLEQSNLAGRAALMAWTEVHPSGIGVTSEVPA